MNVALAGTELVPVMLERAGIILKMTQKNLPLKFLGEFELAKIDAGCERINSGISKLCNLNENAQRELVQNPVFAEWLEAFQLLLPEEELKPPAAPHVSSFSGRRNQPQYQRAAEPSHRSILMRKLFDLLKVCQENDKDITRYPVERTFVILSAVEADSRIQLVYLENYADTEPNEAVGQTIISSLRNCEDIPLALSPKQKELMLQPSTGSRYLFSSAPFEEIWALLESCLGLLAIVQMFHQFDVRENLGLTNYRTIAQDAAEYDKLLRSIISQMSEDAMSQFVGFWRRSGCLLHELRRMENWIAAHPGQDWDNLFATYGSYVNLLYGKRFQSIDPNEAAAYQEDILIFAITHNKKRFIRLVDEHTEAFLNLPHNSMIFQEQLYQKNFNLNELTEQDLRDCAWMRDVQLKASNLIPDRRYTFPELRALYGASREYFSLYNALKAGSQDYRLMVLRQLRKRKILWRNMEEQEISALAECLDHKPLHDWLQEDFGYIKDLTPADAARMLVHLDELRRLRPGFQSRTDVQLALENLDSLEQFSSMDDLRWNVVQVDKSWEALSSAMELSQEFMELHWENIVKFVCNNGAYIAETYRKGLNSDQDTAFLRVVKAELMGQLKELKYFEGDLQYELGRFLADHVVDGWKCNLHMERNGMEVRECDDFFSTMLLGVQPQYTCLSYTSGSYRECLLSSFDSNKKVLYVELEGRIVGRAFLRLTKGRLTGADGSGGDNDRFTFVDLENISQSRREAVPDGERLTLFLEHPYISCVGPKEEYQVKKC